MNYTYINLTPHDITVLLPNNDKRVFKHDGTVARVSTTTELVSSSAEEIPVYTVVYGKVIGLPEPVKNTRFIVSAMVKNAVPQRTDLVSPGELVRDANGNVIGCRGFYW